MLKIVAFLLLIILLVYCTNPFSTREPEQPIVSNVKYDPAISSDIVLINFKQAIENKDIEEYMRTVIDPVKDPIHSFRFIPEPHFQNDFANAWTVDDERDYFTQLTRSENNDYPKLAFSFLDSVILTPITPISIDDSVESNNLNYEFRVDYGDSTEVYKGIARFKLFHSKLPPEHWYIYFWRDNAIEREFNATWTFLKRYIDGITAR